MVRLFQTGDSTETDLVNVGLELSNNVWLKAALLKALSLMCDPNNWTQMGDADIDFARDKSNEMYISVNFDVQPIVTIPVGATMTWHTNTPPDRWLFCDGSAWLKTDYPELYALWGGKYGENDDFFAVVDMGSRSPYGVGPLVVLDAAYGSETHTLTVAEMPAHGHRIPKASATIDAGVNTTLPNARTDNPATPNMATNLTGGSAAHNNMPPVRGVNFIVYGGVAG